MALVNGFTLIEILVSLMLIAIMLLGIDAAQSFAYRQQISGFYADIALHQIDEMSSRIRTNKGERMSEELMRWHEHNQQVLPHGKGAVSGAYPNYSLTVFWGDEKLTSCTVNKTGRSGCLNMKMQF